MKNLYVLSAIALLFVSCSDSNFLNLDPPSFENSANFFETEEDFELAVNGAYEPLQSLYSGNFNGVIWVMTEMRSDNTSYQLRPGAGSGHPAEIIDEFVTPADNEPVQNIWQGHYQGISRANVILEHIEEASFNEESKQQFEGEARFLRAFYYFNMVRLYGGVPLFLEEVKSPGEAYSQGRATEEEVYEVIISDATQAIELLPADYSASEAGRATEGAARTLLADVYMTRQNFQEASAQFREVTSLGYKLLDDYAAIYDIGNKNHEESIFPIQYLAGQSGTHSDYMWRFMPFNSGDLIQGYYNQPGANSGWNIPTGDMLDAYEPGDLRRDVAVDFIVPETADVINEDTVYYVRKYWSDPPFDFQTSNNWPVYRYADVLLMLAEALNEQGFPNQEAVDLLNRVRARAGLDPISPANQQEFREAVWQEQRIELAFENHRWFDLLRTGRAVEVMEAHGQREREMKDHIASNAYQTINILFPIPDREIRLNPNLEQNPGYR